MTKKGKTYKWTLLIEFNGLCAAELLKPPKGKKKHEMIIHFVGDSMHHPILAVRDRDVVASHDCRPDYRVLVSGETVERIGGERMVNDEEMGVPTTVSLWSTVRGAHQEVMGADEWSLEVDTSKPELDKSKPPKPKNPYSLRWLPTLGDILGSNKCNPLHDFAQFRLKQGVVISGRLDPTRTWEITAKDFERTGPLAVTIVYKLVVKNIPSVVLDLHPGMLIVGPPDKVRKMLEDKELADYTVETTYSSLPVAHHSAPDHLGHDDPTPHFNEYNRLVGTDKLVTIREVTTSKATVEDPIHCFDAAVLP